MPNEVLQWGTLVVIAFLLLGVLRQVALTIPSAARSVGTSGPSVGDRAPRLVWGRIRQLMPSGMHGDVVVAYVMENCVACQRLLAEISDSRAEQEQSIMLIAKNASTGFRAALAETGIPTVFDDGALWDEARITSTPLVLRVDGRGRVVAKGVTHHVEKIARPA